MISDHALVIVAFLAAFPVAWGVHHMVHLIPVWIEQSGVKSDACTDGGATLTSHHTMPIPAPSSPPALGWGATVALSLGALFAGSVVRWGLTMQGISAMLLISMLVTLAWIDLRTGLLPDILTKSGAAIGLITHAWSGSVPLSSAVIGFFAGYFSLWLFFQIYRLATHKDGMGFGDFKLFAMLGAWLGWESLAPILLVASLSAVAVAIMGMATKRLTLQSSLPFGPYLVFGGILRLFECI